MDDLAGRIRDALRREEAKSEYFASRIRLLIVCMLTLIALFNIRSVSLTANLLNFGALTIAFFYSLLIYSLARRMVYRSAIKYVTSCIDVTLVMLVLYSYTTIELPSVALKNYVFYVVFLMIGLTGFRYNPRLTWTAGGVAIAQYLVLFLYLTSSGLVTITHGSYEREFFSAEVTYTGQITKIAILCGFVALVAFLSNYSRKVMIKLVHDELRAARQKEKIDAELAVASVVQTKLLPHSFPSVDKLDIHGVVQEGRFIGGDYCDFFKLADDRLLVVQADVCGSGIPAALTMAQVHAAMHLLASMKLDLISVVQQLNSLLYQSTDRNKFISFFIAEINTSLKILHYANAGHPPPLIYSHPHFALLSERTIPLGIRPAISELAQHQVPFLPGDLLVAYADGLAEQTDSHSEEFGQNRLQEFMSQHYNETTITFISLLLGRLRGFTSNQSLNDDVSIAAVRFLKE